MPWTEWKIMDQREQFVRDYLGGDYAKGAHPLQNPRSNPTQLRSDYGKDGVVTFL